MQIGGRALRPLPGLAVPCALVASLMAARARSRAPPRPCAAEMIRITMSLPKRGVRLQSTPVMQPARTILVAFLGLLFVVSTNTCALAAAFLEKGDPCCENERVPGPAQDETPCRSGDCAPCATLESGVNLAALVPLSAPVVVWTEDFEIAELMRRLARAARDEMPAAPPDPATIPSPPWRDVLKKAQPVRGPSLAV